MRTTIYLIRHAQSRPSAKLHHSEWPLSSKGEKQAEELAALLEPLGIEKIYSSPFLRCLQTVGPFSKQSGLAINIEEDLRERLVVKGIVDNFMAIWDRSWEDFNYALPGCETSAAALKRFTGVMQKIFHLNLHSTLALSSHGNVIGLFLHSLDRAFGKRETEELTNPDVLRITCEDTALVWDSDFHLPGIARIASDHMETPVDW